MKYLFILPILALLSLSSAAEDHSSKAILAIKSGDFAKASFHASKSGRREITNFVFSQKCSKKECGCSFKEITAFLYKNPNHPEFNELKARAEELVSLDINNEYAIEWFRKFPPSTDNALKIYAQKEGSSQANSDHKLKSIRNAWVNAHFSQIEEKEFFSKFKHLLRYEDHYKKIDELLWKNDRATATRLLHLVNEEDKQMFRVRISILSGSANLERLFKNLPERTKYKSGVLYSYIKYHHSKDPDHDITDFILRAPVDKDHSNEWWRLKVFYIRELLKERKFDKAYQIALKNGAVSAIDVVESEWLAGWISHSFLHKPHESLKHFKKLYDRASHPMSLSRGAYWIAESYKKIANKKESQEWYKKAARFPETFYGQLALYKLGITKLHLPPKPKILQNHLVLVKNNELLKIAKLLDHHGLEVLAIKYIKQAVKLAKTPEEVTLIVEEMAKKYSSVRVLIEAAKAAAHKHVLIDTYHYPRPYKIKNAPVEHALIYSIIRQESAFDVQAVSTAKAMGLMQLIEPTAKTCAKKLKVSYSKKKLLNDPAYNIKLGSNYWKQLLENLGGSYILSFAAYNAGPGNPLKWIQQNGDPRKMNNIDDIVQWIELVPFYQTRDYIQRVLENIQVYRYLINKDSKLRIVEDLKRHI